MLTEAFCNLHPVNILVVGDLILDLYTKGVVERISPEAPVPILHVKETLYLPGGAANVARNLLSLGANVSLVGRVGDDKDGEKLLEILSREGIATEGVYLQKGSKTPMKNRFIAGGQQLIRTDYETISPIEESMERKILFDLKEIIEAQDLIAISDYAKGFLSDFLLREIFKLADDAGIRVIVDPKGKDFKKYRGAYLVKPNSNEAYVAADADKDEPIESVARKLLNKFSLENLLITRSEKGMALFDRKGTSREFLSVKKDVLDVTGAGDTALAMLTFAIANEMELPIAIELANIASGIAIEELGCAKVRLSDIAKVLLERHPQSKIYQTRKNFFVIKKALEGHDIIVFDLRHTEEITTAIYHTLKQIQMNRPEAKRIIYLPEKQANQEYVQLLASMYEVDFVLLTEEGYNFLIKQYQNIEIINENHLNELVY